MYVCRHAFEILSFRPWLARTVGEDRAPALCVRGVAWSSLFVSFRFSSRIAEEAPDRTKPPGASRSRSFALFVRSLFRSFVRSFHTLDTPRQVPALAPVSCRHADRGDRSEGRRSHPPQDLHAVIAKEVVGFVVVVVVVVALAVALGSAFFPPVFFLFFSSFFFFLQLGRVGAAPESLHDLDRGGPYPSAADSDHPAATGARSVGGIGTAAAAVFSASVLGFLFLWKLRRLRFSLHPGLDDQLVQLPRGSVVFVPYGGVPVEEIHVDAPLFRQKFRAGGVSPPGLHRGDLFRRPGIHLDAPDEADVGTEAPVDPAAL
mmetsp:Transcript_27903/g.59713  ORF Transcript_27903/g.59713 Transcript_27903/m.59713 type:complete len:317 (-) Transcript_27903:309-1259(-)